MAMRPPIPSIDLSRRAKIALWTWGSSWCWSLRWCSSPACTSTGCGSARSASAACTRPSSGRVSTLFFIFGVLMALIIGGNLVIAYLLSPPFRPMSPEQQNIERYRAVLEPRRFLVLAAIA